MVSAAAMFTACPKSNPGGNDGGDQPGEDAGGPAGSDAGTDGGSDAGTRSCDWTQWGKDPSHGSYACGNVQAPNQLLAQVVYDPFVEQELAEADGPLTAHYPSPLMVGDDVYMMQKTGSYLSCEVAGPPRTLADGGACGSQTWDSQIWNYKRFHWESGQLVEQWSYWSDWKPVPASVAGWEPPYQGAVAGGFLYIPGAGGSLIKLDRITGVLAARISPFGATVDANTYVVGGLAADPDGNILYNVITLDPANPKRSDVIGSWLVKVRADDSFTKASYTALVPGAPAPTDLCYTTFPTNPDGGTDAPVPAIWRSPYPPAPDGGVDQVYPPQLPCGSQRAGVGIIPAIAPNGTIYTASRAHLNPRYSYVVAVNPDLSPKWAASLRDRLDDGCGVNMPIDGMENGRLPDGGLPPYTSTRSHCRVGATPGVENLTNLPPAGTVDDSSSSSPVALPDNGVIYGALTYYNESRGHLMKFDQAGTYQGSYDFGWDVTPAVRPHDGTYSIVVKDNHYFYWNSGIPNYLITEVDANLTPLWNHKNVETNSCTRETDGGVTCVDDGTHPDGFEWCINAPAVDPSGNVYVNSEDGNMYVLNPDGTIKQQFFLRVSLEAAYTPLSIDSSGRIYTLNHGEMFVLGQ